MVGGVPGTTYGLRRGGSLAFVNAATIGDRLRGSFTQLAGVDQRIQHPGVDLSISKGFALFTPYAGFGKVWVKSTPKRLAAAANPPTEESLTLNKGFVGLNMNFVSSSRARSGQTGEATSYG